MWPGYEDSLDRALDSTLSAVDIDDRLGPAHYPYRSRETGERLVRALRAAGFPE